MRTYLIIPLLFLFSCEEPKDCAGHTSGDAFIDDCGICTEGGTGLEANYLMDCEGTCNGDAVEDVCGSCNGTQTDPSECGCDENIEVCLSLNGENLNYESTANIAGFQFSHNGCAINPSGGDAAANGFSITSSNSAVIAFSMGGFTIPAGSGILINLGSGECLQSSLSQFVFSDSSLEPNSHKNVF